MSPTFHAIRNAESEDDREELQRIFNSITTEQLNEPVDIDPGSILLQRIIHTFDPRIKYSHLVIGLFDSPNVDTSRLNINHEHEVNGRTALMFAAYRGNLEVVEKLMSLGANMQITTADNRTAFGYACWMGHIKVVKFFLPLVELREYTLKGSDHQTIIEVVQMKVARIPEKPFLDIMKLLAESHEEKLAEVWSRTEPYVLTQSSKALKPVDRLNTS